MKIWHNSATRDRRSGFATAACCAFDDIRQYISLPFTIGVNIVKSLSQMLGAILPRVNYNYYWISQWEKNCFSSVVTLADALFLWLTACLSGISQEWLRRTYIQAKLVMNSVNPLEPSLWNINHSFTSVVSWGRETHTENCVCVWERERERERERHGTKICH